MRWTGIIVILFVFFHLADLTWGAANPDFVRGEVYDNMVYSFSRVPVAIAYVVANLALGVHIFHGAWSLFASLGVSNPRLVRFRRSFASAFTALILIGNLSFPILVQAKVIS
jgi:succinate dehydrogenase / fumarate reductase cytochrome b subunit